MLLKCVASYLVIYLFVIKIVVESEEIRLYTKSDEEISVPECNPPCVDAKCIAPNKCQCIGSLKILNKTHCVHSNYFEKQEECSKRCNNGECDLYSNCICNDGYESILIGTCVEKCNTGYVRHNGSCMKTCDLKCVNGKCLDDQCICNDDLVILDLTNCVTKEFRNERENCDAICENGKCSDSNECHCQDRFKLDKEQKKCEPICSFDDSAGCINGKCVAPNECVCFVGYKFDKEQNKCEPICSFEDSAGCINGKCIAPNQCECFVGYELDTDYNHRCNPVCESCSNGFCKEPGVCVCNEGFILDASGCKEKDKLEHEKGLPRISEKTSEHDHSSQSSSTTSSTTKKLLNSCEKPCDDGSCAIDGKCPKLKTSEAISQEFLSDIDTSAKTTISTNGTNNGEGIDEMTYRSDVALERKDYPTFIPILMIVAAAVALIAISMVGIYYIKYAGNSYILKEMANNGKPHRRINISTLKL